AAPTTINARTSNAPVDVSVVRATDSRWCATPDDVRISRWSPAAAPDVAPTGLVVAVAVSLKSEGLNSPNSTSKRSVNAPDAVRCSAPPGSPALSVALANSGTTVPDAA